MIVFGVFGVLGTIAVIVGTIVATYKCVQRYCGNPSGT